EGVARPGEARVGAPIGRRAGLAGGGVGRRRRDRVRRGGRRRRRREGDRRQARGGRGRRRRGRCIVAVLAGLEEVLELHRGGQVGEQRRALALDVGAIGPRQDLEQLVPLLDPLAPGDAVQGGQQVQV